VTFSIRVKEVVRTGRILVHAFLDEAHSENACIEIDVVLGIARNAGYMVESGYACHASWLRVIGPVTT
jgi:hypothetical protein